MNDAKPANVEMGIKGISPATSNSTEIISVVFTLWLLMELINYFMSFLVAARLARVYPHNPSTSMHIAMPQSTFCFSAAFSRASLSRGPD